MTTLRFQNYLSLLAFLPLRLSNLKSYFTPLCPAGQMLVNRRGVESGGSAFSLLSCYFFLLVGGGNYEEKRKYRTEKASEEGVGKVPSF